MSQLHRVEIIPLVQRNFNFATGVEQLPKGEYRMAMTLAALVRAVVRQGTGSNSRGSAFVMLTADTFKEIAEQGAWLDIEQVGEELKITVALK